jgi:hypothetical protein
MAIKAIKARVEGDNYCGVMEEGRGLTPGEGGSHGGPGAAA